MGADVGNAYLEALTNELIYFIAGPEFAAFGLEGHTMILFKALYGLKSSGQEWHKVMSKTLKAEGFKPSLGDPDVWMRKHLERQIWEYICVYVDDLALAMVDGAAFLKKLQLPIDKGGYGYKIKGDGPLLFHLGCDYYRDADGTLVYQPKKYIVKMMEAYFRYFKEKPKQCSSPLPSDDHPELDDTILIDCLGITIYMSLVGMLQWLITLGRLDVMQAVTAMSAFRCAPRQGHMDRAKRIYGYVDRYREAAIRVRPGMPDLRALDASYPTYDWSTSVYGSRHEEFPMNMPEPLGGMMRIIMYVDANLYFDLISGRACTGILILLNQTPVDWYCKKQSTVATATFGSEFVAAKTAVEKAQDLKYTLRMFGIPVDYVTYMFGDNQAVVTQGTIPHSQLAKRHHAVAYHYVREAVANGSIKFFFIPGKFNPADVLTKFLGYQVWWPLLPPPYYSS
jgi:hypothetical protein